MKKLILTALLCGAGTVASAQEASGVLQLFSCNLAPGKTFENVWSTLEMTRQNVDRSAPDYDPGFGIFIWAPFRQGTGYALVGIIDRLVDDRSVLRTQAILRPPDVQRCRLKGDFGYGMCVNVYCGLHMVPYSLKSL